MRESQSESFTRLLKCTVRIDTSAERRAPHNRARATGR